MSRYSSKRILIGIDGIKRYRRRKIFRKKLENLTEEEKAKQFVEAIKKKIRGKRKNNPDGSDYATKELIRRLRSLDDFRAMSASSSAFRHIY